jgi:hypothetical protein
MNAIAYRKDLGFGGGTVAKQFINHGWVEYEEGNSYDTVVCLYVDPTTIHAKRILVIECSRLFRVAKNGWKATLGDENAIYKVAKAADAYVLLDSIDKIKFEAELGISCPVVPFNYYTMGNDAPLEKTEPIITTGRLNSVKRNKQVLNRSSDFLGLVWIGHGLRDEWKATPQYGINARQVFDYATRKTHDKSDGLPFDYLKLEHATTLSWGKTLYSDKVNLWPDYKAWKFPDGSNAKDFIRSASAAVFFYESNMANPAEYALLETVDFGVPVVTSKEFALKAFGFDDLGVTEFTMDNIKAVLKGKDLVDIANRQKIALAVDNSAITNALLNVKSGSLTKFGRGITLT